MRDTEREGETDIRGKRQLDQDEDLNRGDFFSPYKDCEACTCGNPAHGEEKVKVRSDGAPPRCHRAQKPWLSAKCQFQHLRKGQLRSGLCALLRTSCPKTPLQLFNVHTLFLLHKSGRSLKTR